jgi:hypothetical protein
MSRKSKAQCMREKREALDDVRRMRRQLQLDVDKPSVIGAAGHWLAARRKRAKGA